MNGTKDDVQFRTFRHFIDEFYPPVLIFVGVTCNILVLMVMRTRYFRYQPSSVYMIGGAINDIFSLSISMTTHWLHVTFDVYSREKTRYICKFLDFYGWGNCDLGILITTAMTIDRALAITFPLKKNNINTFRRAKTAIIVVSVITVAKEFHFFFGSDMVENRSERLCDVFPKNDIYRYFWTRVWPWLHLVFLLICFILMFISNIVLLCSVWKSSHKEILNSVEKTHFDRSIVRGSKQVQTITPMLIGESVVLLLLTFPFSVQLFVFGFNPSVYQSTTNHFLFSLTFYMLYTNKCVTCFVYIITGHRFRLGMKELITTCCYGKTKLRHNLYQSTIAQMRFPKTHLPLDGEHNTVYDEHGVSINSLSEGNNNSKRSRSRSLTQSMTLSSKPSDQTLSSKPSDQTLQRVKSITSNSCQQNQFCACLDNASVGGINVKLNADEQVVRSSYL